MCQLRTDGLAPAAREPREGGAVTTHTEEGHPGGGRTQAQRRRVKRRGTGELRGGGGSGADMWAQGYSTNCDEI
jgi:hypothetical protein